MSESPLSDDKSTQLCQFALTVWGNSDTVLRRLGDIDFINLRPYYPAFRRLFVSALSHDKILIREEYRTAVQALATDTYYEGAYITGQPGIGKTLFLIYVLVIRLGQERAVALRLPDGRPFYVIFHSSGVSFHSLNDAKSLDQCPDLWALTDSNSQVKSPSSIFLGSLGEIRVIQATSPKESRWKEWSKQSCAVGYVMDIWSTEEIVKLLGLLGLETGKTNRMTYLAERWGGVPRSIMQFMGGNDSEIEALYRQRAVSAISKCREIIPVIAQNAAQFDDSPSQIFFCRPMIMEYGINRKRSRATVPMKAIRFFLGSSETTQVAGIIFENLFHGFINGPRRSIQCHWVQGAGETSVKGQTTLIPTNWSAVKHWAAPYLWVAPKNFEGIDSILVLQDKIYTFQVTISARHRSPVQGIKKFQGNLPTALKSLSWSVVFIGDSEYMICNVAKQWVGHISLGGGTEVPIAWSAVDPTDSAIAYQEYREEEDDAMEVELGPE